MQDQFSQLLDGQNRLCDLFLQVVDNQDWRPDPLNWSFRLIAAHMALVEKDCFIIRIDAILRGGNPTFSYYWNTEGELGGPDLRDSVTLWVERRRQLIERLRFLRPADQELTGYHDVYGNVTPLSFIQIALDHDREHLRHFEKILAQYQRESDDKTVH